MGTETVESLELVLFSESQTSVQVFTGGGMAAVLSDIEAKVRAKATGLDISTETGRAEIRSLAFQVRKTKVALDNEGKRLTELWRKQTTQVNEERKKGQERLDALAEEVRKPLTEFEEAEKRRVEAHEQALVELGGLLPMLAPGGALQNATAEQLEEHMVDFSGFLVDRNWEEFAARAQKVRHDVFVALIGRIESRKAYEKEQAELARLRAEEAERKRVEEERLARERDARLQAEAAEAARLEAERLANQRAAEERQRVAAEAERVRLETAAEAHRVQRENDERLAAAERQRLADLQESERQRQREEQARFDAEEAARATARKAEADRIANEERVKAIQKKAADDAKKASEKARKDREAALQAERDRLTAENVAAQVERRRREEDEANKARVRAEIIEDITPSLETCTTLELDSLSDAESLAKFISDLIMAGKVRNVRVQW